MAWSLISLHDSFLLGIFWNGFFVGIYLPFFGISECLPTHPFMVTCDGCLPHLLSYFLIKVEWVLVLWEIVISFHLARVTIVEIVLGLTFIIVDSLSSCSPWFFPDLRFHVKILCAHCSVLILLIFLEYPHLLCFHIYDVRFQ